MSGTYSPCAVGREHCTEKATSQRQAVNLGAVALKLKPTLWQPQAAVFVFRIWMKRVGRTVA